mmetsp:Transcript_34810/g.92961  ORF Transcript_34810/g.92961 Transcript_34810/m.92961 type:complete len:80 (-) Transcript_34810:28-267(-)
MFIFGLAMTGRSCVQNTAISEVCAFSAKFDTRCGGMGHFALHGQPLLAKSPTLQQSVQERCRWNSCGVGLSRKYSERDV